jgi:dolichol-phosphate mannosyltransferase
MIFDMKICIIIPTYNERENISLILGKITSELKNNRIFGRILVVDDNSPDGTGKIAESLGKKYPVSVLHRKTDRGYGNSTLAGFRKVLESDFDVAITMDADLSHNPAIIPVMLKEIEKGYDVVIGSRKVKGGKIIGWNLWRHACSRGATLFCKFILGLKTRDITSGFRAYKTNVLKSIPLSHIKSNGYSFLEELLCMIEKKGFKIKEVPIVFYDRKKGKSKLSKKEIINFFIMMFKIKFRRSKKRNRSFLGCSKMETTSILIN